MDRPNYARYLESVYQDTRWEVARVPHGSINATLRVTKTAGHAGPQSLILKHASAFFEDEGQLQPFSLNRQVRMPVHEDATTFSTLLVLIHMLLLLQQVEVTMLSLWDQDGPLAEAAASPESWRLPKFIRHDEGSESGLLITDKSDKASILLLEDLGEVVNLFERVKVWAQSPASPKVNSTVSRIGNILGHSLATMHSRETARKIESRPETAEILSQSLTDDVVWYLAMEIFPEYLANVPKAEVYYQRLVEDIRTPQYAYPACLVHGDFNFGNIMLPLSPDLDDLRPFIIDWEFATTNGRGVNGDVSEFLSILHCRLVSARRQQPALGDLLRQLCNSFSSGYRQTAALECKMERGDLSSQLYRSTLLLNGRDMINYAKDACTEDETFDEMMGIGLWYLERACDNMDDFLQKSNLSELVKEDEGLVRSLFIFK